MTSLFRSAIHTDPSSAMSSPAGNPRRPASGSPGSPHAPATGCTSPEAEIDSTQASAASATYTVPSAPIATSRGASRPSASVSIVPVARSTVRTAPLPVSAITSRPSRTSSRLPGSVSVCGGALSSAAVAGPPSPA
jgi:hypothetical protein